ncbi:MAG: cysteine--tRNA ligase [Deltaproteobacteria bacterium]|nr:cysteine--tRNA ligase [Deltaproteobacteria bacterium]
MDIRFYNTLHRSKEPFQTRDPGRVGMYVCGPTVYDDAHIGHARAYVAFDVLARFLRFAGFEVTYVRNYTDIDDKVIHRAREAGTTHGELAQRYIDRYREDMERLRVLEPDVTPRVTDHLTEIVAMVQALVERGHGYVLDDGVYFSIRSYNGYGRLSGRKLDEMMVGARVEVDDQKHDPLDFALWKLAKPDEPSWPSPWGPGRPGWHIECSAMSLKYLGPGFDIHGGGMDLIFPHHENEIAQSVCATGREFVRTWMHNGFVNVNKEKMSKSLGNFFTIRQAAELVDAEAIRLFLLGTHYRGPVQFDVELSPEGGLVGFPGLVEAERRLAYGYETVRRLARTEAQLAAKHAPGAAPEALLGAAATFDEALRSALADDLNHAEALGHLATLQRTANDFLDRAKEHPPAARLAAVRRLREALATAAGVLGVFERDADGALGGIGACGLRRVGVPVAELDDAIRRRTEARRTKDFAAADRIRAELLERGIELMDAPGGTEWRVVKG